MGTANKQIATRANVNSKRLGAFVTSTTAATYMKKCVTKKAVTDIQYLRVNNREATTTLYPTGKNGNFGGSSPQASMSIRQSSTYNTNLSSSNITVDSISHNIWCLMYANVSYNSSTYVNLSYSANWPMTANAKYYALYKRTLTVPTNQLLTLSLQCSIKGAVADSGSGISGANSYYANSITWYPGVIITNSDDSYCITSISPSYTYSDSYNNNIAFTSNYSTINVYFLISSINMSFSPSYEDYYAGFVVNCNMNLTYNDSYYDQTYKLVQYQDIAAKGGTFTCNYVIYNNKSLSSKLDYVRVYIGATSDRSKGTWTQIGSASPGNVDSYKTGNITCTIPSTYSLAKQLYMYVHCGNTNINQQWYSGWGNYVAGFKPSENWGKVDNAKTPVVPLTSPTGAYAVLNHNIIRSAEAASMGYIVKGVYGQTSTRTALFRIE